MANKGPAGGLLFDQRLVDCSQVIKVNVISLVMRLMVIPQGRPSSPKGL